MPKVLVPLAQGCEELESVTIIDLLRRAGIDVVSASLDGDVITASRGVRLVADVDLDTALTKDYDMVILPGGLPGADHLDKDERITELLKSMANSERFTAAICAAPKVFANHGLLDHKRATSYPGVIDTMHLPNTEYLQDNVVRDGTVITSRGPATAIEFTLELIEILTDKSKREEIEQQLLLK